ncbi:MAG: hypothetical protein JWM11_5400 [Planctomycetaceae bacterium]|nr:hypothetical protein [Planctomycetaceae bacterium]
MFSRMWLFSASLLLALAVFASAGADEQKGNSDQTKASDSAEKSDKKSGKSSNKGSKKSDSANSKEIGSDKVQSIQTTDLFHVVDVQKSLVSADLADASKFSRKTTAQRARIAAVFAQLAVEQISDSQLKKHAAAVRDIALELAEAETVADAREVMTTWNALKMEIQSNSTIEYDWQKLIDVRTVMAEVKIRFKKLSDFIKTGKEDTQSLDGETLLQINILIGLGTVLETIDPGLKDQRGIETWRRFARDFKKGFLKFREQQDNVAAWKGFLVTTTYSCAACHEKFKK